MKKLCRKCGEVKRHGLRSDDQAKPRSSCVECSSKYYRSWREAKWQRRKLRDTWRGMIDRCHSPRRMARWVNAECVPQWTRYGMAGVKVCRRWRGGYEGFLAFVEDMGNPPSPDHTLDRIRNSRGYSPSNCRWATREEQARNRANAREVTASCPVTGAMLTMNISEWSRLTGVSRSTISARLNRGWDPSRAVEPICLEGVPF